MNENNRNQIIIAGVLGVVLAGVLIYQFVFNSGPAPLPEVEPPAPLAAADGAPAPAPAAGGGVAARPASQPAVALRKVDIDIPKLIQEVQQVNFDYAAVQIDRDPMDPLVGNIVMGASLDTTNVPLITVNEIRKKKVTGIVFDGEQSVAIVDDELVAVGHEYENGISVSAIDARRVTFKVGDTLIPVELKEMKEL
ncbi:MAG: hypothetical protein HYV27_00060 [Candidatus Hydrogenedentes bacterium]|nr:hypothetical protein [Candidatus Hydrogenedentota bacterium]